MIYAIGFYWFCAGLASFRVDRMRGFGGLAGLLAALLFGGVAIPVRILAKLAE